jgi:hypothetical protein
MLVLHAVMALLALLTLPAVIIGFGCAWVIAIGAVRNRQRDLAVLSAALVLLTLAWLPFGWHFAQHPEMTSWITAPNAAQWVSLQAWAVSGSGLFQLPMNIPEHALLWGSRALGVGLLGLALLGACRNPLIGVWYFGALTSVFAASWLIRPLWTYRYFMPFFPALFVLVARGIELVWQRRRSAGFALAGSLLSVQAAAAYGALHAGPIEDWRSAARHVATRALAGDVVVAAAPPLNPQNPIGVFDYYYRGAVEPTYWDNDSLDAWELKLASLLAGVAPAKSTLWLVLRVDDGGAQSDELSRRLSRTAFVERERFARVDVLRVSPGTRRWLAGAGN